MTQNETDVLPLPVHKYCSQVYFLCFFVYFISFQNISDLFIYFFVVVDLFSFAFCLQLGWAKRAGWLEEAMAGPGRPVTGPGRTRGRLVASWAQRIALQQAQAQAEPVKIPKKRGPKPGSKVVVLNVINET